MKVFSTKSNWSDRDEISYNLQRKKCLITKEMFYSGLEKQSANELLLYFEDFHAKLLKP